MANIYDAQFRERAIMHCFVCEPGCADIIYHLIEWLDRQIVENERLRKSEHSGEAPAGWEGK